MLGINFGSTNLTIARMDAQTGMIDIVRQPSVLIATDGHFVIGQQAVQLLAQYADLSPQERREKMSGVILNLRDNLKPDGREFIAGHSYTHQELLGTFFKLLFKEVTTDQAASDYVVLTHPVEMAHPQVEMFVETLHQLGVNRVKTIIEPFATVKGYETGQQLAEGEGVLLFDYGATQTDACYIKKLNGKLTILATPRTNNYCGGQDLDYVLYQHLANTLKDHPKLTMAPQDVNFNILQQCRQLKEMFSSTDNDICTVEIDGVGSYRLSREAFNSLVMQKVDEAINVARMVATDVKNRELTVDKILLAGGGSRMPLVMERLTADFPNSQIVTCTDDGATTAKGTLSQFIIDPNGPYNLHVSMTCRQCQSPFCYRYKEALAGKGFRYHCMECGWEGSRVVVVFN